MPRLAPSFLAFSLVAAAAGPGLAQDVDTPSSWHLAGGYTHYKVGGSNGWGDGGEAILYHAFSSRIGGQFRATVIASSDGFYTFSGAAVDLGPAIPVMMGQSVSFVLGIGPSALLGGDSDGSVGFGIGGHGSLRATAWLARGIGVYAEGALRVFQHGETNPAFSGGISFGL